MLIPDEPFESAEAAWLWTMSSLIGRRDGTGSGHSAISRPCTPDDVVVALERLYRTGRVRPIHATVLRRWGEQGYAPSHADLRDAPDRQIWDQALVALEPELMARGIVRKTEGLVA
jgi:hypothetical protein